MGTAPVRPAHIPTALTRVVELPVSTLAGSTLPLILAGKVPVVPVNAALRRRREQWSASDASLDGYARAARLLLEFAGHRRLSLIGVSDVDFGIFVSALAGASFQAADGTERRLPGRRSARSVDHVISLLYGLAADIEELYCVEIAWRRYRRRIVMTGRNAPRGIAQRVHRVRWAAPKVWGLPDDQFEKLVLAARDRWGDQIADGDRSFAPNPEAARGALFHRNLAVLLTLRFAGARRAEAPALDIDDIDRKARLIRLRTKGRHPAAVREPVVLLPWLADALWTYLTHFRPLSGEQRAVFVSHSTRNYGQRIGAQSVRKMLDALRPALDEPWSSRLRPHLLRHAFAYELQRLAGQFAVTANLRHRSVRSADPYAAGPEQFADELLATQSRIAALVASLAADR